MTDLTIRVDASEAIGLMGRISDNYGKAQAWALNRTAQEVNGELQREAKSRMIIRDARGWRVLNDYAPLQLFAAQKARPDKPWATAVNPQNAGKILRPFETGAFRTTNRFGAVPAIPTKATRPTPQSVIDRKNFPTALFPELGTNFSIGKDPKAWNKGKGRSGKAFKQLKPFIMRPGVNPKTWGIYQRTGPGKDDIRMLWAFRPIVHRPKLLTTYETAQRVVAQQWPGMMLSAFRALVRQGNGQASILDLTV
jgi:hypothetical protein